MNRDNLITLFKCILLGGVIFALAIILGIIIRHYKSYYLNDILLLEGLALIIIGIFSCIGTGSTGLYFRSDKNSNTQFTVTDNSGNTKYERDISSIRKIMPLGIVNFSLFIGGLFTFLTSYMV